MFVRVVTPRHSTATRLTLVVVEPVLHSAHHPVRRSKSAPGAPSAHCCEQRPARRRLSFLSFFLSFSFPQCPLPLLQALLRAVSVDESALQLSKFITALPLLSRALAMNATMTCLQTRLARYRLAFSCSNRIIHSYGLLAKPAGISSSGGAPDGL